MGIKKAKVKITRKPTPGGPRKPDTGPGPCPDDIAGPIFGKHPYKGV